MSNDCLNLPFYPKYETEYMYGDKLRVTWFESNFSQSYYNQKQYPSGSNACTLIAVLMASKCHQSGVLVNEPPASLNGYLICMLAESMLEGNKIHHNLKMTGNLKDVNLTVPEAIKFASEKVKYIKEWRCKLCTKKLSNTLFDNIKKYWIMWLNYQEHIQSSSIPDLYIILVADSRSVLFIIQHQSDMITLVDSHQHSLTKGAFIASCVRPKLKLLCQWYTDIISKCYKSDPSLYELSFLYFSPKQNS